MEDGLVPVTASILVDQQLARRQNNRLRGHILTGCKDIDEYVLLGGFERGSVVGVSAEEDELGLLIGLQTVAHMLVTASYTENTSSDSSHPKAMIITTLPVKVLLPRLRQILVNQVASLLPSELQNINKHVQRCLENISISIVFDIEGLREVLGEIGSVGSMAAQPQQRQQQTATARPEVGSDTAVSTRVSLSPEPVPGLKMEILDSQDEDADSPIEPETASSPILRSTPDASTREEVVTNDVKQPLDKDRRPPSNATFPDFILITHIYQLMNALFTGRDKPAAHDTMACLSSELRQLAGLQQHSPLPSSPHITTTSPPLVMLLNSTTTPYFAGTDKSRDDPPPPPPQYLAPPISDDQSRKLLPPLPTTTNNTDPTLRSIFTHQQQPSHLTGKNKPAFGMVFSQLLDLHLLCTRVPRSKRRGGVAWVVEVLLDELGVYEYGDEDGGKGDAGERERVVVVRRQCREQRWGAVDVEEGGGRVVDALR